MGISKAEAIILHSRKQGETSKILTLYTREYGKISVMAKGSRGLRSKYLGTLEMFNHVSIVFYRKEGRSLQYLSDASIVESFPLLHGQLGKIALAAVACEMVDVNEEEASHPEQFQLLLSALRSFNDSEQGLRNILRAFQIQYISHAGYAPMLEACCYCQKLQADEVNFLSLERGVYSCGQCGLLPEASRRVRGYVIELLRWLKNVPIENAAQARVSRSAGEEMDAILADYLKTHVEAFAHLHSIEHLKKLQIELGQN
ncbi:DNA repair protein RecO [candidate division KSB1 bacterium]|nr:DNA repair protein RecO [candidate division KSB1 bacterium]RQW08950.1 MAG: DNA repair protein RecO [candidate division KSB1 bacterium]